MVPPSYTFGGGRCIGSSGLRISGIWVVRRKLNGKLIS